MLFKNARIAFSSGALLAANGNAGALTLRDMQDAVGTVFDNISNKVGDIMESVSSISVDGAVKRPKDIERASSEVPLAGEDDDMDILKKGAKKGALDQMTADQFEQFVKEEEARQRGISVEAFEELLEKEEQERAQDEDKKKRSQTL